MRKYILFLALTSCASVSETTFGAKSLSQDDFLALQNAATNWNKACNIDLKISTNDEGDVNVRRTTTPIKCKNVVGANGCTRSKGNVPYAIDFSIEPGESTRIVLEHEIGHVMGLKHRDHGIMLPSVPLKSGMSVSKEDCKYIK